MNRSPYYIVGEKVIIDSKEYPEFHGKEYYVDSVQYYMAGWKLQDGRSIPEGYYYHIPQTNLHWKEINLKKIYVGGNKSLDQIMKELMK